MTTFDQVWQAEFEPQVGALIQRENEMRTDAFLDVSLTLCGEPVRQMTPADLVLFDALGNPFVAGGDDGINELDCVAFIWQLHPENDHTARLMNLWRRARLIRRLSPVPAEKKAGEIMAYCDRMFMDLRRGAENMIEGDPCLERPPATHFLAPLMINLCADMGHVDPMSGELLAHTPLPRLLQYSKAIARNKGAENDYGFVDSMRSKCLAMVNERNAAERAAAARN